MVQKESLDKELRNFSKRLSNDFNVDRILLFGSRAEGNIYEESDIDLIIVSPDFKRMNFFERVSMMYNYWEMDLPVDFLCYTPSEFNKLKKGVSIVSEALKKGLSVA